MVKTLGSMFPSDSTAEKSALTPGEILIQSLKSNKMKCGIFNTLRIWWIETEKNTVWATV